MEAKSNTYSRECFDLFHVGNDEAPALREAAFTHTMRRLPELQTIVDVCCGIGTRADTHRRIGCFLIRRLSNNKCQQTDNGIRESRMPFAIQSATRAPVTIARRLSIRCSREAGKVRTKRESEFPEAKAISSPLPLVPRFGVLVS